jgi:hypothetical protein
MTSRRAWLLELVEERTALEQLYNTEPLVAIVWILYYVCVGKEYVSIAM